MALLIEIIGWAAALTILASYLLVSTGRLSGTSAAFQWMNLASAAGFIVNSGWHGALPSAVLNIAWAMIGLVTLIRIATGNASARAHPTGHTSERARPNRK